MSTPAPSFDGIGIANLPNQVCIPSYHGLTRLTKLLSSFFLLQKHKIVAKRGAHFTIMVVGACFEMGHVDTAAELKYYRGVWTGQNDPHQYPIFHRVVPIQKL